MGEDINQLREELEKKGALDIECLVFKGGGVKGYAYGGAVKVLEELGVLNKVQRLAGTSIGAMFACLLAVGGTSEDIDELVLKTSAKSLLYDATFGTFSLLPNILTKFGWHPGDKLLEYFRTYLKKKTGNPDITFMELYKMRGVELCVVATNVSNMTAEYCHPKTTPHLSIALATRCSVALPGLLQPVKVSRRGQTDFLVDGGLVSNFPIHCFDGWYLSMKKEDSFFHRLGSNEEPFGEFNKKSLGLAVYAYTSRKNVKYAMENHLFYQVERPQTFLSCSHAKYSDEVIETEHQRHQLYEAGKRFVKALHAADLDRDGEISIEEYRKAFIENKCLCEDDMTLLFGKDFDIEATFQELDEDKNGQVTAFEFLSFMQDRGVIYKPMAVAGTRSTLGNLTSFIFGTLNTIFSWAGQLYYKPGDAERTMMYFVDYIDADNFVLEDADKEFLRKVGQETALWWFKQRLKM